MLDLNRLGIGGIIFLIGAVIYSFKLRFLGPLAACSIEQSDSAAS